VQFICRNPAIFCEKLSGLKLGIASNYAVVEKNLGEIAEEIEPIISKEYSRLYVDILGLLSPHLAFRILLHADDPSLGKMPSVSRKWSQMLSSNQLWKFLCYHRGWGIIFVPPKSFEWKSFYRKMAVACRRRLGAYEQSYDKEIHGIMGLKYVWTFFKNKYSFIVSQGVQKA
jgi:hypothetical protein